MPSVNQRRPAEPAGNARFAANIRRDIRMRRPRPIDFSISCSDLRLIYGPSNELTDEYLTSSL